jgi:glutathione S-transferase
MGTVLLYTPGTCSLACTIALHWLGQPFELCRVEKPDNMSERFLRLNARGQVPVLQVAGRYLAEVNAILVHIADRDPSRGMLPPEGTWEHDLANQWLSRLSSDFHPAFWPYFSPQKYIHDPALHDAVRQAAIIKVRGELAFVDKHLSTREFVLDGGRSLLDGYLHAMDRWANKLVDMPKEFPNVFRHQKTMARDASVRFGVAIERADGKPIENPSGFIGHVELASLEV